MKMCKGGDDHHREATGLVRQEEALVLIGIALSACTGDCPLRWRCHVDSGNVQGWHPLLH